MKKTIIPVNATRNIHIFKNIKIFIDTLSVVWPLQNIHMGRKVKCAIALTKLGSFIPW